MASEVASDFQKIITQGRERKKNEALAAKIFGKDARRSSLPQQASHAAGSFANRAGVNKRAASAAGQRAGNLNGDWTHDLHEPRAATNGNRNNRNNKQGSLASRITVDGPASRPRTQQRRAAKVAQALIRSELDPRLSTQVNVIKNPVHQLQQLQQQQRQQQQQQQQQQAATRGPLNRGMSIRGLAGPYVVMAQNFAPGTTAADIESAMTPYGGIVTRCVLIKTTPILIAEIEFESKEGAENVIAQFNNQTADGRLLHVYPKIGGSTPAAPRGAPTGPRAATASSQVIDGSMGFEDPMGMDVDSYQEESGLYSDRLVNGGGSRRGRGFRGAQGGYRQ